MQRNPRLNLTYFFTLFFYLIFRFIVYGTQYFVGVLNAQVVEAQGGGNAYIAQSSKQILSYYVAVSSALPWVHVLFVAMIALIFAQLSRGVSRASAKHMVVNFNILALIANVVMVISVYFLSFGTTAIDLLVLMTAVDEAILLGGSLLATLIGYGYLSRMELQKYR